MTKQDLSSFSSLVTWGQRNVTDFDSNLVPVKDVTVEAVVTSIYFNTVIFVVLMVAYEFLRRRLPHVYSSYKKLDVLVRPGEDEANSASLPLKSSYQSLLDHSEELESAAPVPPLASFLFRLKNRPSTKTKHVLSDNGILDWIQPVLDTPWTVIRKHAGLDGYFFLRYIRLCVRITAVSTFWIFLLLVPVYASGNWNAVGWYHLSISNIEKDSWRMWMPPTFCYLFSFFVMYVMKREYRHFLELRQDFLASGSPHVLPQKRYSLMVENIPYELRSDKALFDYFSKLFPGKVHSANIILKVSQLEEKSGRCMRSCRRLEKSIACWHASGKRPSHRAGTNGMSLMGLDMAPPEYPKTCWCPNDDEPLIISLDRLSKLPPKGKKVDSISYYAMELAQNSRELAKFQRVAALNAALGSQDKGSQGWIDRMVAGAEKFANHFTEDSLSVESSDSYNSDDEDDAVHIASKSVRPSGRGLDETSGLLGHDTRTNSARKLANKVGLGFVTARRWSKMGFGVFSLTWRMVNEELTGKAPVSKSKEDSVRPKEEQPENATEDEGTMGCKLSSCGFVTLLDLASVTCAVSSPLTGKSGAIKCSIAPEPRDINWQNAQVSRTKLSTCEFTVNVVLFLGVILWSFPLAAIQAFAKAEYLAELPGMYWILTFHGGEATNFVNGYLPVCALLTLIMILPLLFEQIALFYERRKTFSDVQASILSRYFYYQLANAYVSVTAGSILKSLADILDHPSNVLSLLGDSLPTMVGYFVSLVLTKTMAGLPMVLLRFGALSRMLLLRFLAGSETKVTQRELDWVYRLENVMYGWEFPAQLFVVVIVFTYAIICPIILPVGMMYFLGSLIVYRKQILYVYSPVYESGGAMFPIAMQRTMFALVCSQMTLLGYLGTRCIYQPMALVPLPVITVWVMRYFCLNFAEPSACLSLERARHHDRLISASDDYEVKDVLSELSSQSRCEKVSNKFAFDINSYRQPVLTEIPALPQIYRRGVDDPKTFELRKQLESVYLPGELV